MIKIAKKTSIKPVTPQSKTKEISFNKDETPWKINLPKGYTQLSKLVLRDLNRVATDTSSTYGKYTRDNINKYLKSPEQNEAQLRQVVRYIYGASSHFRRLIQYFVGLSDLSYIVEPYKIDPAKANVKTTNNNYRRVLNTLSSMNIKSQCPKILTTCLREDVFYGTLWLTNDSVTIQQLPSDKCKISTIEGNVLNVSFDFSYFANNKEYLLDYYPPEFRTKYETIYKAKEQEKRQKWIELDSPNSFAIKCNTDILNYAIPPFAGILREIYDIEDYKELKLAKTALENYAMLVMKLPLSKDGDWGLDLKKAKGFWQNLDDVLPEEIGSVLSPMEIDKIDFEKSNTGDTDTVAQSEQNLFTEAGVSSLLFNNEKASANALLLSIKADQAITYGIVKSIEDAFNRFIQAQSYGKYFKITFLDVSPYNRKEMGDAYLKAASFGFPTISAYAASQGIGQAELDSVSFLESKVLKLQDRFKPVRSSTQMSTEELEGSGSGAQGGAPQKDDDSLTDSGEQSREDKDDWD